MLSPRLCNKTGDPFTPSHTHIYSHYVISISTLTGQVIITADRSNFTMYFPRLTLWREKSFSLSKESESNNHHYLHQNTVLVFIRNLLLYSSWVFKVRSLLRSPRLLSIPADLNITGVLTVSIFPTSPVLSFSFPKSSGHCHSS